MQSPQSSVTHSQSFISVHLQAIFVAIVIAHFCQASATISASIAWFFAFKTLCFIHSWVNLWLKYSDFSTETVQTRIGCQVAAISFISFTT